MAIYVGGISIRKVHLEFPPPRGTLTESTESKAVDSPSVKSFDRTRPGKEASLETRELARMNLKRRVVLVPFVAAALVGLAVVASIAAGNDVQPAAPNDPTYALSGFTLEFDAASSVAHVAYETAWTTTKYPGEASCVIEVVDASGRVVGSQQFGLDTYSRTTNDQFLDIPVSGTPASARGFCGAAPSAPGSGYAFSDVRVGHPAGLAPGEVRLIATGHWIDGLMPPVMSCTAIATLPSGRTQSVQFTLAVGDGDTFQVVLPASFAGATDPSISCTEFTG